MYDSLQLKIILLDWPVSPDGPFFMNLGEIELKYDGIQFLWKIHFHLNLGKRAQEQGISIFWNICHLFLLKVMQKKVILILDLPSLISCLPKFLFWSFWPKCSWPTRLQDSLKCKASTKNLGILQIFCFQKTTTVSYKLLLSFFGEGRHAAQSN